MNDIVPVGPTPANLLFEPTDTVNSRTIALQQEVDRLKRGRRGAWVFVFILFLLFLSAVVAGASYAIFNQSATAASAAELEDAIEERDEAVAAKEEAERQEEALRDQAQELYEYARVAELQFEVNDERRRLDDLIRQIGSRNTGSLDRERTIDLEIQEAGWTVELQEQALNQELDQIADAIGLIEDWLVRSAADNVVVPRRRCNPFKRTDADCE